MNSTADIIFPNLNIAIDKFDRVAINIFGFNIYWYGIFICIGAVLGIMVGLQYSKQIGIDTDFVYDYAVYVIISGVIGARLYYVIFHEHSLRNFFAVREGGLAIYGGIIAGALFTLYYTKKRGVPFLKFGDVAMQGVIIGQIVGRWGNFVNREAFGKAAEGLTSLWYKAEQVPNLVIKNGMGIYNGYAQYPLHYIDGTAYISVHPTFLYESLWNLAVLIFMFIFRKHKRFDGQIAAIYFICYGIGRFFIESMRTDQLMIGAFPVSMLLSAILVIFWTGFMIFMLKKKGTVE